MKKLLIILVFFGFTFADYAYSLADNNTTSPTYGMDVWNPEYQDYITLHFFSSQGWAGWTATFGQLSDFQEEIRNDYGYENVVIIAVGQSNTSGFNSSFCGNSDLPLVIDPYPSLPIRDQFGESSFNEFHKKIIILGHDGQYLGMITVNSVSLGVKNYILDILAENYQEDSLLGDLNNDEILNILDVIQLINLILAGEDNSAADMNGDDIINILDVIQLINIILLP